jgi:putative transposase
MPKSAVASTYLSLRVHLIFATRHRAPSISGDWKNDLHAYIGGTLRGLGGYPLAIGGTSDHVHVLAGIKATQCVADLVRDIKKASQSWATEKWAGFHWQEGYAALSVSPGDVSAIAGYIANQEAHHKKVSSQDELRRILSEFGIEYDPRFFE